MKKHILTLCEICGEKRSPRGFTQHIKKTHNTTIENYIIKYIYKGNHPTCQCGCGKQVTFRGYQEMDYILGHAPVGHFKKNEPPRRDYNKWKNNLTTAIRQYNREAKQKDLNYRKGKNNNFFGKHHTEQTKQLLRNVVEKQIKEGNHSFIGNDNGRIGRSSLELKFEKYLETKCIIYEQGYKIQYLLGEGKFPRNKYYDFYIPIINTLVEIHGSYWHPQHHNNLSEIQIGNLKNDQFKKKLAKDKKYNLLTIYDYELDNFIQSDQLSLLIDSFKNYKMDLSFSGFTNCNIIKLPDYWIKLIDMTSITVNLTSIGRHQNLYIVDVKESYITIANGNILNKDIDCYYTVWAERRDVDKLIVEVG